MTDQKVKLYRNNHRGQQNLDKSKFLPQYQTLGIEPQEFKSPILNGDIKMSLGNKDNPRIKQYNEPKIKSEKKLMVPNIGNTVEQSWSSVDGIIDDLSENYTIEQVIDNNDYISDFAFNNINPGQDNRNNINPDQDLSHNNDNEDIDLLGAIENTNSNEYILIVEGTPFCSGSLPQIEEQASLLLFGEHEYCQGNPVQLESLIILKKMNIKVGLFAT